MSVHHQTCGEGREEVQALALDGKTFALSHTYADDGNYTVTVTVSDARNVSGSGTLVVTVANVAPVVGQISGAAAPLGSAAGVSTGFSDAGSADASHTATWNWGDGQTSTGQVTESGGQGTASGSHAYAATGVYQVGLMVADKDGGIGQAPYQYVAVYGGNGAVAAGAGWIDSRAGAYGPDPSLAGKAMFGFVSRYQKGATRPDGRAQFRFHAAGMTFESTGYQWLAVAGAKAQFKGQGQIQRQRGLRVPAERRGQADQRRWRCGQVPHKDLGPDQRDRRVRQPDGGRGWRAETTTAVQGAAS